MWLPFDLNSLDTNYRGMPTMANITVGSIDLSTVDYNYAGQPFVVNNGPLNQSASVSGQNSIASAEELSISTGGGGISIALEPTDCVGSVGGISIATTVAVALPSLNTVAVFEPLSISTITNLAIQSIDDTIQSEALSLSTQTSIVLGSGNPIVGDNEAIAVTFGATAISLGFAKSLVGTSAISLSLGVTSINLEGKDSVIDADQLSLSNPILVGVVPSDGVTKSEGLTLQPITTTALESGSWISDVGAVEATVVTALTLTDLTVKIERGVVSLGLGAAALGLGGVSVVVDSSSLVLSAYLKSNPRATWGLPDSTTATFSEHDGVGATFVLREQSVAMFSDPTVAIAGWGEVDKVVVTFSPNEHF